MVILQNNDLIVEINENGAELNRLYHKKTKKEYLWNGDTKFWGRKAPLLFPIVGKLKDNKMWYNGEEYQMSQHGFARDLPFSIKTLGSDRAVLHCTSSENTKKVFPFDWSLYCEYSIQGDDIAVKSKVVNESKTKPLLFSIGYHPAFKVPIDENLTFDDYYLIFNGDKKAERWMISDGLISEKREIAFDNGIIRLNDQIFSQDALVFKGLNCNEIKIRSEHSDHGITFSFDGFPYLGIWSKAGASFVCIEPWHGIANSIHHNGDFLLKEGIIRLNPGEEFDCGYTVGLF